jgi:transcriptional regulator with XRE-family HTH domain
MEPFASIGERLREVREALDFTQAQFAAIAAQSGARGATRQSQALYEKGERLPDAGYLSAIASAGADVLYVVTGRKEVATPKPEQPVQFSDQHRLQLAIEAVEEGLAEMKRKLPPAKKAELIGAAYELMAQPEQAKNNVIRLVRVAA